MITPPPRPVSAPRNPASSEPPKIIAVNSREFNFTPCDSWLLLTGVIDRVAAGTQRTSVLLDIATGSIESTVYSQNFTLAERLIGRHSFTRRLPTFEVSGGPLRAPSLIIYIAITTDGGATIIRAITRPNCDCAKPSVCCFYLALP